MTPEKIYIEDVGSITGIANIEIRPITMIIGDSGFHELKENLIQINRSYTEDFEKWGSHNDDVRRGSKSKIKARIDKQGYKYIGLLHSQGERYDDINKGFEEFRGDEFFYWPESKNMLDDLMNEFLDNLNYIEIDKLFDSDEDAFAFEVKLNKEFIAKILMDGYPLGSGFGLIKEFNKNHKLISDTKTEAEIRLRDYIFDYFGTEELEGLNYNYHAPEKMFLFEKNGSDISVGSKDNITRTDLYEDPGIKSWLTLQRLLMAFVLSPMLLTARIGFKDILEGGSVFSGSDRNSLTSNYETKKILLDKIIKNKNQPGYLYHPERFIMKKYYEKFIDALLIASVLDHPVDEQPSGLIPIDESSNELEKSIINLINATDEELNPREHARTNQTIRTSDHGTFALRPSQLFNSIVIDTASIDLYLLIIKLLQTKYLKPEWVSIYYVSRESGSTRYEKVEFDENFKSITTIPGEILELF